MRAARRRRAAGTGAVKAEYGRHTRLRGRRREPESLGNGGLAGAQHLGRQHRQVEAALTDGTHHGREHLLSVGALAGAVAAAYLADDHRGPDGLFGPPVGGVDRRVPQEEEHGGEFVGKVLGEALGVFQRWRRVDQPTEPGLEPAAERVETVSGQLAVPAAVPKVEAGLENGLDLRAPRTVGVLLLQFLATLKQVIVMPISA